MHFDILFAIFNNMLFFVRKVNLYLIDIFLLVCPYIFNDKYLNCTLFLRPTFETMALFKEGNRNITSWLYFETPSAF